jgi:hypothetical protein
MEGLMEGNRKYSLVGTWRGSTNQTGMQTDYETTLNQDMTFATTVQSISGVIRTTGTYKLVSHNAIEFTNLTKWPNQQTLTSPLLGQAIGPLDFRSLRGTIVHDVNIPDKDTSYFQFVDENTIMIASGIPGVTPVAFRREGAFALPLNAIESQSFQSPFQENQFFTPSGANQPMSSDKTALYIFLAFVLVSSLLAFGGVSSMR